MFPISFVLYLIKCGFNSCLKADQMRWIELRVVIMDTCSSRKANDGDDGALKHFEIHHNDKIMR